MFASLLLGSLFCVAATTTAPPMLAVDSPVVRIGKIEAGPDMFGSAAMPVSVTNFQSWELYVTRIRSHGHFGRPPGGAEKLFILDASGTWTEVTESKQVLVATGSRTDPGGSVLTIQLHATATLDAPAGPRDGTIEFTMTGASPLDVDYDYEILPTLSIAETAEQPAGSVNPIRPGTYPFVSKSYLVKSNVPWVFEVSLSEPLITKGGDGMIGGDKLVIVTPDRPGTVPLKLSKPARVTGGEMTGEAGAVVQFQIALTSSSLEIAGTYTGDIEAVVRERGGPPR